VAGGTVAIGTPLSRARCDDTTVPAAVLCMRATTWKGARDARPLQPPGPPSFVVPGPQRVILLAKLVLVPLLIAAITVAGQRLGPRAAGALAGLPVVAGPIALFLALEQGAAFGAHAAVGTLAGIASLAAFCVIYALSALRLPWWASLLVGWAGFALSTLALQTLTLHLVPALVLALLAPLSIRTLTPRPTTTAGHARVPRTEIALRMAAGATLVVLLTAVADLLGPRLSGLLTVFPIAVSVLAASSHRSQGAAFAVQLLRGLAGGLNSLTAFFLLLALLLERAGIAGSFAAATLAALAVQAAVLRTLNRGPLLRTGAAARGGA
jgi:hypothetical protein